MAPHYSILAGRVPWSEEPEGYNPGGRKAKTCIKKGKLHCGVSLFFAMQDSWSGQSNRPPRWPCPPEIQKNMAHGMPCANRPTGPTGRTLCPHHVLCTTCSVNREHHILPLIWLCFSAAIPASRTCSPGYIGAYRDRRHGEERQTAVSAQTLFYSSVTDNNPGKAAYFS